MSYRLAQPPRILAAPPVRRTRGELGPHLLAPQTIPLGGYSIVPLGNAPPPAPFLSDTTKRMLVILVVVVGLLAFLWWQSQQRRPRANGTKLTTRKDALARTSTPELAKRLYERLDNKGQGSPALKASLQRIARKA